jgi:hypothetical protein
MIKTIIAKKSKKVIHKTVAKSSKKKKTSKVKVKLVTITSAKKNKPKKVKLVTVSPESTIPMDVKTLAITQDVSPVVSDIEKKVKKPSVIYFTQDTENAVVEYNKEECQEKRNTLYNTRIKYSFEKLVENIFNTFKFTYFDVAPLEFQKETVAHLVANISKYQPEKGKAFGYFSIVAKHYLIFHNNNNYARYKRNVDISETPSETTVCLQVEDKYHKDVETSEFLTMMVAYWEKNLNKIFTKQKDLNIANAVIELFRNSDRIEAFNKKALYLYIREISSCKTQQITKVINKMKQYQTNITKCYINNGIIQPKAYKS